MMRKRFLSLTCALALCLSLLPATALAADGDTVYVGGVELTGNTSAPAYANTDGIGNVSTTSATADNYNIKWDGSTLTLKNAYITNAAHGDSYLHPVEGAAIGVANSSGDAELTIQLESGNTIEDVSTGIFVFAHSSSTGDATLTITGDGNLTASGSVNPGILVQSNDGNATLSIENAEVTTTSSSYCGVQVRAKDSSNASLTVNGGSLTATGKSEDGAGIRYTFGGGSSGSGKPSLTVSNSAIVKASSDTGGITSNSSTVTPSGTGIVFNNGTGTVYGSVELQENLTIGEGESLTLDDGASLNAGDYDVIVDGGTLDSTLATNLGESVIYKVTKVELDKTSLTLDVNQSETLTATITPSNATNPNVTWSSNDKSVATVENGVVTAVSAGNTTIKATVDGKSANCTVTVKHGNMVHTPKQDATCTEAGHTEYWYCSGCQKYFSDENGTTEITQESTVIPATGHTFRGGWCAVCGARDPSYVPPANPNYRIDVTATAGGAVTKDPAAAKAGETVTLIPAPDAGYEVGDVTVTDRFGDAVAVTENADGTYTFTMPSGQVRVEVTFVEATPEPLPFTDVNEGDWFHDAVRYVYDNGLMDGVGEGQFAPNATTNRAMVVTILYRLAGEPTVSGQSDFTDVAAGLWYTDAVLWAAQKGIVNGISETEFAPSGDLTREQLATILYRYAQDQGYDVSAQADLSGFPDAGDIQSYATQALSWAVAEGLLQGFEDDTLQPQSTATRAQIATILMRFCEGVGA